MRKNGQWVGSPSWDRGETKRKGDVLVSQASQSVRSRPIAAADVCAVLAMVSQTRLPPLFTDEQVGPDETLVLAKDSDTGRQGTVRCLERSWPECRREGAG